MRISLDLKKASNSYKNLEFIQEEHDTTKAGALKFALWYTAQKLREEAESSFESQWENEMGGVQNNSKR